MVVEWRGMLAPLGVPTGDGRRFLASGMTSRELPLPLKWQRADVGGHDSSVIVGSCEVINYGTVDEAVENGWISAKCIENSALDGSMMAAWGQGQLFSDASSDDMPRLAEDVAEVMLLLEKRVVGPSVDPGSCQMAVAIAGSDEPLTEQQVEEIMYPEIVDEEEPEIEIELEMLFTEYQIAAATLVSVPAFQECRPFELVTQEAPITAAVRSSGWDALPFADRGLEWDSVAADQRISEDAGIGTDSPDWNAYASAFLYQDDAANPETKGAYGFQIVDIIDGVRTIVPRAVFAVAATLEGARGGTVISQEDQDAMKNVVSGLYARMAKEWDDQGVVAPWDKSTASIIASVMSADPYVVDRSMFDMPTLSTITPITIMENGRVFGHIATHDVCHVGVRSECVTAPMSVRQYSDFHRYAAPVDGDALPVGRITVGHGKHVCTCGSCRSSNDDHACLAMTASSAIAHHDHMSTVAWVRAYEDVANNAIVVSGVLAQDASVEDIACLARARVSGDWRPIGGHVELVEVLSLARERPGFPLPMARMVGGSVAALTAAGTVHPSVVASKRSIDIEDVSARIVESVVSQLATRLSAIPATMEQPELSNGANDAIRASAKTIVADIGQSVDDGMRMSAARLAAEI
jgi:hypothetical protein